MLHWIDTTLYVGLPYCLVTLAFAISFKYLRLPDVTAASTFVLGAATAAIGVVRWSLDPYTAILLAVAAGALGGCLTAGIHLLFRIDGLLASILSAFSIYAVNLLLLHPTLPYGSHETVLGQFEKWDVLIANRFPDVWHAGSIGLLAAIVLIAKLFVDAFLRTELGYSVRALEDDTAGSAILERLRIPVWKVKTIGLAAANGLVSLAGALSSMTEGAANLHRGFDVLITGLIAFLLGVKISEFLGRPWILPRRRASSVRRLPAVTTGAVLGPLIYFGTINFAHRIDVPPEYAKLVIAAIVVATAGDLVHFAAGLRSFLSSNPQSSVAVPERNGPLVEMTNVSFTYDGDQQILALRDLSLRLYKGQMVLVRGPVGSGKSTLAKLITGRLDRPEQGVIRFQGLEVTRNSELRRQICEYVEQDSRRGLVNSMAVYENLILSSLGPKPSLFRPASTLDRRKRIEQCLDDVGVPASVLSALPGSLSGGQRQLVNQLSALCRRELPRLACFDEPFNNLDHAFVSQWLKILRHLKEQGVTVLVVTHAREDGLCPDLTLELNEGRLSAAGSQ